MKNKIIGKDKEYRKYKLVKILSMLAIVSTIVSCISVTAFADGGATFDNVVAEIVGWVKKIGGVVAFIGGVQFGLGFKNDDADGKTRGLMTLAAGFIVVALCVGYNTLFAV